MKRYAAEFSIALTFALAGCQSVPPQSSQNERQDLAQKTIQLTESFMLQADDLERAAMRMYYAIKSPTDDVAPEDCNFVADEKNRQLPLTVFQSIKKLREAKGLLGLPETKEDEIRYRDMRDSMEWSYHQFARTHTYCKL